MDHIRRILAHADGAVRCYLAMLAAELEQRWPRLVYHALWMAALIGFGLVGVAFFAFGLSTYLQSRVTVPGVGALVVGAAMVAVFVALMAIFRPKQGK